VRPHSRRSCLTTRGQDVPDSSQCFSVLYNAARVVFLQKSAFVGDSKVAAPLKKAVLRASYAAIFWRRRRKL
jgi:hypothetical protein